MSEFEQFKECRAEVLKLLTAGDVPAEEEIEIYDCWRGGRAPVEIVSLLQDRRRKMELVWELGNSEDAHNPEIVARAMELLATVNPAQAVDLARQAVKRKRDEEAEAAKAEVAKKLRERKAAGSQSTDRSKAPKNQ